MAKVIRKKGAKSFEELRQIINGIDGKEMRAGWFESARYDDNTPVAFVASIQEFGAKGIPPRPFMRPTVSSKKQDWKNIVAQGLQSVVDGNITMEDLLDILGLNVAGEIRKAISQVNSPPLSPVTLALRKQKLQGQQITGKRVGWTAAAIARGDTASGQLGDTSGVNPKPLVFDAVMLNTLTHVVGDK